MARRFLGKKVAVPKPKMLGKGTTSTTADLPIVYDKALGDIGDALETLSKGPLTDGKLSENLEFTAGVPKRVTHGLGRKLRLWFVVRTNTDNGIFEIEDPNTDLTTEIWLGCAGNATVSIYFA